MGQSYAGEGAGTSFQGSCGGCLRGTDAGGTEIGAGRAKIKNESEYMRDNERKTEKIREFIPLNKNYG